MIAQTVNRPMRWTRKFVYLMGILGTEQWKPNYGSVRARVCTACGALLSEGNAAALRAVLMGCGIGKKRDGARKRLRRARSTRTGAPGEVFGEYECGRRTRAAAWGWCLKLARSLDALSRSR